MEGSHLGSDGMGYIGPKVYLSYFYVDINGLC